MTLGIEYLELDLECPEVGFEYLDLEVLLLLECKVEVFFLGVYVVFIGVIEDLTDLDLFEDTEVLFIEKIQAMEAIPITTITT